MVGCGIRNFVWKAHGHLLLLVTNPYVYYMFGQVFRFHIYLLYSLGSVKLHEGSLTASWGAVERPAGHGLGCGHAEYGEAAGWAHAGAALAGMDPGGLGRHLRQEGGRVPHGHTLMVLAV